MAKGLTAEGVKHAKAEASRREIPDGIMPGLYLVVQPSGIKTWAIRYRFAGVPVKFTLGRYPAIGLAEARQLASENLRRVAEGKNPAAEKAKAKRALRVPVRVPRSRVVEFEAVVADFITNHAQKKTKDWKNTQSLLTRHFVTRWRGMDVGEIQKRDVLDALEEMIDDGLNASVNRAFSQLRKMYNWLVENDRLKVSPCYGIKKPAEESSRDRYLKEEEVYLHWQASDQLGYPFGPCYKLLLLSGQRLTEVSDWRWDELNGSHWTLSKERTKNGRPQELLLPRQAMEIVGTLPRIPYTDDQGIERLSPFLFTTTGYSPISGFSKKTTEHAEVMLAIAKKRATDAGKDPADVTIERSTNHDLRRTLSTHLGRLRIRAEVIEATLNHVSGKVSGVAAVYNRWEYFDEKAEALQTWADGVDTIVAKFSGENVVQLRAAK